MKLSPSNNTALPELNGFAARSFWLQLLTVVAMILNSQGIDLFASLCALEIGCTPDAVLATGDRIVSIWQQALPIVTGIWAYLERRAPHYRLVWPWKSGALGGFLIILLLLAMPPGVALAAGPQCADRASVAKLLPDKYGERALRGGIADNRQLFEIYWNADTGSWTATVSQPNGTMCFVASGQGWTLAPQPVAEGDPT